MVDLIGTVLWLAVGIVANEPAECGQALSRCLHIDNALNDATDIIGVRMKGKLSCTPRFFLPSVTCWKAIENDIAFTSWGTLQPSPFSTDVL